MDYTKISFEELSAWFKKFAETECKGVSDLYYDLSIKISEDKELIKIASHTRDRQPMPNLFLGAVHYLLLGNPSNELAQYYPSINKDNNKNLPFNLFKEFCISHPEEIIEILQTKIVQTNSLNRSAYLMPIFFSLFHQGEKINIIDIGTSAGLNLNFDLYEYHYNEKETIGKSPVKINSEIKGGTFPEFNEMVQINKKIGLDQNVLDLQKKENELWLKALIWADKLDRLSKMDAAIQVAQKSNIELIKSNTINDFERIINEQELDIPLVVYHTHVLYQFKKEERIEFWEMLDRVSEKRDFYYLGAEWHTVLANDYGIQGVVVELTTYKNGKKKSNAIAETNGHANWIKWT